MSQFPGFKFYNEVGFLVLGAKDGQYTTQVKETANSMKEEIDVLTHKDLKRKFPYLATSSQHEGVYTSRKSGHIDARTMVKAQKQMAMLKGCDIIDDIVHRITPIGSEGSVKGDKTYQIEAERSGKTFHAKKVLLTTGAFVHSRDLLPAGWKLDLMTSGIAVLLVNNHKSLPIDLKHTTPTELYLLRQCFKER